MAAAGSTREPDPAVTAVFDELKPYLTAAGLAQVSGAPAEVLVPVVRRLLGKDGVALGPGLVSAGNALIGMAVVRCARGRTDWRQWPLRRTLLLAATSSLVVAPFAAAGWERAVVFRGRSPLWGVVVSPAGWIQIALLCTAPRRVRRERSGARSGSTCGSAGRRG